MSPLCLLLQLLFARVRTRNWRRGVAMAFNEYIYYFFQFCWAIQTPRVSDCRLFCCFAAVFIVAMRLHFAFYFIVFFSSKCSRIWTRFVFNTNKENDRSRLSLHQKKTNKYEPASNGKTLKNFIAKSTTITTIVFAVVVYGSEWMENPLLAAGLMAFVE